MDAGEILATVREKATPESTRNCVVILTEKQYEAVRDDADRVSRLASGEPTTILGMPIYVVGEDNGFGEELPVIRANPVSYAKEPREVFGGPV